MFDFEKLELYDIVKDVNVKVFRYLKSGGIDLVLSKQLKRSTSSILLNLAEGTGRMSKKDKQYYYTIARGSVFESVAILDLLLSLNEIDGKLYKELYGGFEQCSKMLLGMYRSMDNK